VTQTAEQKPLENKHNDANDANDAKSPHSSAGAWLVPGEAFDSTRTPFDADFPS
jgi:hypothetical protein